METIDLRLECLRLAVGANGPTRPHDDIVVAAQKFLAFVEGGERNARPKEAPQT